MAAGDTTCAGPEDPTTWAEIQQDTTTLVEHPALFWADGEEASKLCVTLRHKGQSLPLGDPLDPKVSLKIDVNELVPGQRWHGVRKLSLEDGADIDTATEGIAWNLQRIVAEHASTTPDFTPGLANWVTVAVNGTEYGIYTNLEQKDKSLLPRATEIIELPIPGATRSPTSSSRRSASTAPPRPRSATRPSGSRARRPTMRRWRRSSSR